MFKAMILGAGVLLGGVGAAQAAPAPIPTRVDGASVILVGEGCGPGAWRGPNGVCHPFYGPGGPYRGTAIECPRGWHIGPGRARCWPNR